MTISPARIRVDLGSRGYDVVVGDGVLANLGKIAASTTEAGAGARTMLAFDDDLPAATVDAALAALRASGFKVARIGVLAAETEKSLAAAEQIVTAMAREQMDRKEPVVALGGGIVGDVAGFAAAIYRRGVPLIQCPTTLLAMVDASVGGKTAVNLEVRDGLKKNMVGAFHQPRAVVADVQTLASLPERVFRAGLAECLKHGLIAADWGDPGLLEWMEGVLDRILARDPATLVKLVARNVLVKAAVVGRDEREEDESGGRALLNLGHTFGHAIETLEGVTLDGNPASAPLHHGEAVALGLIAAARCAEAASVAEHGVGDRVRALVARCGLPTAAHGLPGVDAFLALMAHDKKVLGGRLRLVLPTAPGRAIVATDPPRQAIEAGLDAIRAT